ncbi:syndecan-3-like [Anoplopoma fimbria]|uniref:syndecan-3-like n=1 Tax=Anoplopoma fimbria TaxID=229290 RepID=UPI0023EA960B|nr:syndecan-3-like [Anoplopoma fimbria]
MRNSLTSYLILALGLIHPISMSFSAPPEDLEGSGYELDSSGFGSGDWSEEGEMEGQPNSKGTKNTSQGPSVLNFENTFTGGASGFVVLANSKSFLENKEIFAAVITGGVIGVVLAAVLAALLIYTWQKKDNGGYILGQQRASDEDYHRPNREVVFV